MRSDSARRAEERRVNMGRTAFGDQQYALRRATLYFTLFELLRVPTAADEAWAHLQATGSNLDGPITAALAGRLGRLDIDSDALIGAAKRVAVAMRALEPGDLILERGEPGYPARLAAASADAPPFLFVRQDVNVLDMPAVAIVGTREASEEGRARARKLAQLLAKRGIAVASGLARGIDAAAHQGALDVGGVTIAVIGTPLTRYYPTEHSDLQRQIGRFGAVISQFAPSSKTHPLCFPLRNATMSALALGTVVIEAAETSGALIQARKAIQQGRKLFIPRSAIENSKLRWPTKYAAQGAHVFATIEDLVGVLEREGLMPAPEQAPRLSVVNVGAA